MCLIEFVKDEIRRLKEIKKLTPYGTEKLYHYEQLLKDYILVLE